MELLRIAPFGTCIVGAFITVLGVVAMIRSIRDAPGRLAGLGIAYLGAFVLVVGAALFVVTAIGDGTLPLLAGVPPFVLISVTAIRLRLAASRAFAEARNAQAE
jgi:hypothetical protein